MLKKGEASGIARMGGLAQPMDVKLAAGLKGASASTEKKRIANVAKMEKAKAEGLLTGRPRLEEVECTCKKEIHTAKCKISTVRRSRLCRERRAAGIPAPAREKKPAKDTSLEWLKDGLKPRRPEDVGRNRKGNKKRKLFVDR